MEYLSIITLALSAWRITEIVTTQDGPFDVFKQLRPKCKVLQCPFCFSVWAGVIALATLRFCPWVNYAFALSWSYGLSALLSKRLATWANVGSKKGRELLVEENGGQITVVRSDFTPQEQLQIFSGFINNMTRPAP